MSKTKTRPQKSKRQRQAERSQLAYYKAVASALPPEKRPAPRLRRPVQD